MKNSPNQISWFEPNTFLNVIGTQVDDGELTGTDKVFKILNKLSELDSIDVTKLKNWEIDLLYDIRKACEAGFCDSKLGFSRIIRAGFNLPPGGELRSVNHVLNDHSYCC